MYSSNVRALFITFGCLLRRRAGTLQGANTLTRAGVRTCSHTRKHRGGGPRGGRRVRQAQKPCRKLTKPAAESAAGSTERGAACTASRATSICVYLSPVCAGEGTLRAHARADSQDVAKAMRGVCGVGWGGGTTYALASHATARWRPSHGVHDSQLGGGRTIVARCVVRMKNVGGVLCVCAKARAVGTDTNARPCDGSLAVLHKHSNLCSQGLRPRCTVQPRSRAFKVMYTS